MPLKVISYGYPAQQPALPKKEAPVESDHAQKPPTPITLAMPLQTDTRPDIHMSDMGVYRTLRLALFLHEAMMMFVLLAYEVHNACSRTWQYVK